MPPLRGYFLRCPIRIAQSKIPSSGRLLHDPYLGVRQAVELVNEPIDLAVRRLDLPPRHFESALRKCDQAIYSPLMAKPEEKAIFVALQKFAGAVTATMTSLTRGEPEDQLRTPFVNFMTDVGTAIFRPVISTGEVLLNNRLGKPDYAIHVADLLVGRQTFQSLPVKLPQIVSGKRFC